MKHRKYTIPRERDLKDADTRMGIYHRNLYVATLITISAIRLNSVKTKHTVSWNNRVRPWVYVSMYLAPLSGLRLLAGSLIQFRDVRAGCRYPPSRQIHIAHGVWGLPPDTIKPHSRSSTGIIDTAGQECLRCFILYTGSTATEIVCLALTSTAGRRSDQHFISHTGGHSD